MSKVATILGFGSQRLVIVLEILAQAVTEHGITRIDLKRSQSMQLALEQAPYRVFLKSSSGGVDSHPEKSHSRCLLLYCLPSSVTEYLAASQEAAHVRSVLLSQSTSASDATVVACYDPKTGTVFGGDTGTVLAALE